MLAQCCGDMTDFSFYFLILDDACLGPSSSAQLFAGDVEHMLSYMLLNKINEPVHSLDVVSMLIRI